MKIIKFKDGTYGIKYSWWFYSSYLEVCGTNFFSSDIYVYKNCRFKVKRAAELKLKKYINENNHNFKSDEHEET